MPFTDKQVNALRPKTVRYEVSEPGRSGLSIRVTPHGVKSWRFRYRLHGAQQRIVFGTYPSMSLADAHLKLAEARKQLETGLDPGALAAATRHAQRAAPTMAALAQEYLERHAAKTMRAATIREDTRILNREILPVWRGRLVKEIGRQDVMEILNGIEDRGVYVMRNRVAGVLSRLFLFALDQGMIDASPAIKLRRLKKIGNKKIEQPRSHFLSKEEIRAFWHNLDTVPITPSLRAALRWALVTGQRRSEIAGTLRNEIDDGAALWTIPSIRTKNEQEQLLPLPSLALQVLSEADAARIRPQPTRLNRKDRQPHDGAASLWAFPSKRLGQPIKPGALTGALNRHRDALGIGEGTVHDLRRTMATWLGELGIAKDLISALLNHAPKGVTEQHYNKASLLGPKRKAMETWSAWLERVIAGEQVEENVIPIARGRQKARP
jgi:integrase